MKKRKFLLLLLYWCCRQIFAQITKQQRPVADKILFYNNNSSSSKQFEQVRRMCCGIYTVANWPNLLCTHDLIEAFQLTNNITTLFLFASGKLTNQIVCCLTSRFYSTSSSHVNARTFAELTLSFIIVCVSHNNSLTNSTIVPFVQSH